MLRFKEEKCMNEKYFGNKNHQVRIVSGTIVGLFVRTALIPSESV